MSPKLFKILLISTLVLGLVILGVILSRAKNQRDAAAIQTNLENPFGLETEPVGLGGSSTPQTGGTQGGDQDGQSTPPRPIQVDFVSVESAPIFQKISEEPVAGATFMTIQRDIIVPEEVSANLVEGYDFSGYPTLKFGDDRKEVADLKTVLNRQDPSPSLSIDNAFDTALKNAVIDYQIRNKLTPDGITGSSMYKSLNEFQGIKPKTSTAPEKETVEIVRFVDRGTGYIFDKAIRPDEPLERVTSSQVARVYEAYFDNTKNSVLMRYLKDDQVENVVGTIKKPEIISENSRNHSTLDVKLLSNKISFVSLIGTGQKAFYLSKESSGIDGVVYDFKTGSTKKIWDSKFTDWLPQAINENLISLTTRASGRYPGNAYLLDVKNNSLRNIISNTNGLTTNVSPDGKMVIYSSYENGSLKTLLLNIATGQISDFAPTTLPEKCIWTTDSKTIFCGGPTNTPLGAYPDDWYKGEVLFSDVLWKIDAVTNTSKIILDGAKIQTQIDVISPMINEKQDFFIFINKHDMNLYGVDLSKI